MHLRLLFLTALLSVASCIDPKKEVPPGRVQDFEGVSGQSPLTPEQKKELEQNLAEIRALGLVDRALKEFSQRFPTATIKEWKAGYFLTKEVVAFSVLYTLPGKADVGQQEFGFRLEKSDWSIWWAGDPPK